MKRFLNKRKQCGRADGRNKAKYNSSIRGFGQCASIGSSLATVCSVNAQTIKQYLVTGPGLFALVRPFSLFACTSRGLWGQHGVFMCRVRVGTFPLPVGMCPRVPVSHSDVGLA